MLYSETVSPSTYVFLPSALYPKYTFLLIKRTWLWPTIVQNLRWYIELSNTHISQMAELVHWLYFCVSNIKVTWNFHSGFYNQFTFHLCQICKNRNPLASLTSFTVFCNLGKFSLNQLPNSIIIAPCTVLLLMFWSLTLSPLDLMLFINIWLKRAQRIVNNPTSDHSLYLIICSFVATSDFYNLVLWFLFSPCFTLWNSCS